MISFSKSHQSSIDVDEEDFLTRESGVYFMPIASFKQSLENQLGSSIWDFLDPLITQAWVDNLLWNEYYDLLELYVRWVNGTIYIPLFSLVLILTN